MNSLKRTKKMQEHDAGRVGAGKLQILRDILLNRTRLDSVQERVSDRIPSADTIVVHVRLADALIRDGCGTSDKNLCLTQYPTPPALGVMRIQYAFPYSWYDAVIAQWHKHGLSSKTMKVVVVGYAYHWVGSTSAWHGAHMVQRR